MARRSTACLRVLGNGGSVLANADDTNIPLPPKNGQPQSLALPDPSLEFTIPGGTNEITLVMRDLENRGGIGFPYRIVVEPLFPDFQLQANDSQVSVPRGGTAAVGVTVRRKGYSGPITVTVADPPAGLTVRPGTIAAGQTAGVLSLSAAADAKFPAAPIKLVARGQGANGPFERLAFKPVVYAQQTPLPTCSITEYGLVAAPALALPVTLDTPPAPIEVAHGLSATIPVKVTRTKGADGALAISPLPLPPGLTIANATIADKAAEGKVTVKSAVAAPLGTMTVGLQAKGKFAGAEQTFALPAVTLIDRASRDRRAGRARARDQARRNRRAQRENRPQGSVRRPRDRQDQRPARRPESRAGHRGGQRVRLRRQDRRRRQGRPGLGGNPGRDRLPDRKERLLGSPRGSGGQSAANQVEWPVAVSKRELGRQDDCRATRASNPRSEMLSDVSDIRCVASRRSGHGRDCR